MTIIIIISIGKQFHHKYGYLATYNSQDSGQFLLGTLGISVPTFHSGQILIPSLMTNSM